MSSEEPSGSKDNNFRTDPLRRLQDFMQPVVPAIVKFVNRWSPLTEGTEIAHKIENGEHIGPDDLTLTGMEMNIRGMLGLVDPERNRYSAMAEYWLGTLADAGDGALARLQGVASPEGAVKDMIVDRLVDFSAAEIINKMRKSLGEIDDEITAEAYSQLWWTFQLSTLTKASCAMAGFKTAEGGAGGMKTRKSAINSILSDFRRGVAREDIDAKVIALRDAGVKASQERALHYQTHINVYGRLNEVQMSNPSSFGAIEARKYAYLVALNETVFGFDIVSELDKLLLPNQAEVDFLRVSDFAQYSFVAESMGKVDLFIERAIAVRNQILSGTSSK